MMNFLCRKPIAPFVRQLGVAEGRVTFLCDPRDGIAREACFMGYYEPQETALMLQLMRPGMSFVDVGANWGYFTLLAADLVGPQGKVIAFEPHPELFSQLQGNILRNDLTWAKALPIAIADSVGEMTLLGFEEKTSNWGVSRLAAKSETNLPQFRVQTGLLEEVLNGENVHEVDMLKMDIEGAELLVLPTMREGLSIGRYKRILLELHPIAVEEAGHSPRGLIEQILSFGYQGWTIDHSSAAFRRAAYSLPESPAEFLSPVDIDLPLSEWPHILFLAPGVERAW